jgi:hypothetical protein
MADLTVESLKTAPTPSTPTLVCRLRKKTGSSRRPTPPATAGEIELENMSAVDVLIEYQMSVWQYLNLHVTDANGTDISVGHYGDCFSPMEESAVVRLRPGEKVVHPVALLGNVPEEKRTPGRYTIQAIYEYKTIRAVSNSLEIEIGDAAS